MSDPSGSGPLEQRIHDVLRDLCAIPAPVGRERRLHEHLLQRWGNRSRRAWITPVGNLVAHIGGSGPKLLLLGHGDEIGFTVRHIDERGYLFLTSGQRLATDRPEMRGSYALPTNQPALVVTDDGTVPGIFATLTGHVLSQRQRETPQLEWSDLWVDVFSSSRDEVLEKGIRIGDRVVWNPPFMRNGPYLTGKAMDNRIALAVLDLFLERLDTNRLRYDLFVGSAVQEEIGLIGAHSINRSIGAELAVSIDIGLSGDVPGVDPRDVAVRLGAGPTLVHKDLYAYSHDLNRHLRTVAQDADIPLQDAVFGIFGSDSGALLREGVAASLLAVPTRYTHSPIETVHVDDVAATIDLLEALVTTAPLLLGASTEP